MNVPVVKVPNSRQVSMKTTKTSPRTSVMKVVTGKASPKKTFAKGTKGPQVSGSDPYGPSENTQRQRKYATQAAVTSYEKVVVDAVTSSSESEDADDDVNQVTDEEVNEAADKQLSMEGESGEEQ